MTLKQEIMKVIKESKSKYESFISTKKKLYDINFILNFEKYFYQDINTLESFTGIDNEKYLFKTCDTKHQIYPIYELLSEELIAENIRRNDTTYAIYNFNLNDYLNQSHRIEISKCLQEIPHSLKKLKMNNKKAKCIVDVEFFIKYPLLDDSQNNEMKDFIKEYSTDSSINKEDLEEIDSLKALEDVDKIHLKFLIFDNNNYIPVYIGIGSNQPYGLSEKQRENGKKRFFKYDLTCEKPFKETVKIKKCRCIDINKLGLIYTERSPTYTFGLDREYGILLKDEKVWKKAKLEYIVEDINLNDQLENINIKLKDIIEAIYPKYDDYSMIFFEPYNVLTRVSHQKAKNYLKKKDLLGLGHQDPINVASDLFIYGYDRYVGLKPLTILLYHMISTGKLRELIINTSSKKKTDPINNE